MPIGDGLIRLGTVLEGFGNEAEARRQLEFKERKTAASQEFYVEKFNALREAEKLGDSFDETALEELKSRSADRFKEAGERLANGLHPDRARSIMEEANRNSVITHLTLERSATRAAQARLKVQGSRGYAELSSIINDDPTQIYSVLDQIEIHSNNVSENVVDSNGNEFQVFNAAEQSNLKKTAISEAYTNAFTNMLYGNKDGYVSPRGLANAKQLLADKQEHIQTELGVQSVQEYKGMIRTVERHYAAQRASLNNWEKSKHSKEAGNAALLGSAQLFEYIEKNPEARASFSETRVTELRELAEDADNLNQSLLVAIRQQTSFHPNKEQSKILNERHKEAAKKSYLAGVEQTGSPSGGIDIALDQLQNAFPSGWLPDNTIEFMAQTLNSDLIQSTLTPEERLDYSRRLLNLSFKDRNHKTSDETMMRLSLIQDNYSDREIDNFLENFNSADKAVVEYNRKVAVSDDFLSWRREFQEEFTEDRAAHDILGWQWGGGGDIKIPWTGITFRIGRELDVSDATITQIEKIQNQYIEAGLPARTAHRMAFRETIMTGRHGNAILVEGANPVVVKNSPITEMNIGENAMNGTLWHFLVQQGEIDPDHDKGVRDRFKQDERIEEYELIPRNRFGKQTWQVIYSKHGPEPGEPVFKGGRFGPREEWLYYNFEEAKDAWTYKEVQLNNPDVEWEDYHRGSGKDFDPAEFGKTGESASDKYQEWVEREQTRTKRQEKAKTASEKRDSVMRDKDGRIKYVR